MASITGNVALILNAHFPYVRRAGRWPHGEESLHEVLAESYVPLLTMLHDLRSVTPKRYPALPLTVAISPVLLEQLADPVIAKHFTVWLAEWRDRAAADLSEFEARGDGHGAYLARFYIDWIASVELNFSDRFGRNLAAAIRSLIREPTEILLTPATYAYLPPLSTAELRAQLETAAFVLLRHLGRRPAGLWLPGGGSARYLSAITGELGIRYAVGAPARETARLQGSGKLPVILPDRVLAEHVIASGIGYPGDALYREFYRPHPVSGIKYWRVTGSDVPVDAKASYDPYHAFNRVEEHANHFVRAIRERLQAHAPSDGTPSVVLAFDAELFGHWWFEGVRWLQAVLNRLLAADDLRLVTLNQVYASLPLASDQPVDPPSNPIFDGASAAPLRERLRRAAVRLTEAARAHSTAEGLAEQLLCQATREVLLAQSGDWQALIATNTAREYAQRRFHEHLARFERLLYYVDRDEPTPDAVMYLNEIAELDNPFPFINYRMFI